MQQLELFPIQPLSVSDKQHVLNKIFAHYWHIRNARKTKFDDARRRKYYRLVEVEKKRLLLAGVPKREILDFLACARLKCGRVNKCQFCNGVNRPIYR